MASTKPKPKRKPRLPIPEGAVKLPHRRLAEGEATGHYHEAKGHGVALYEHRGATLLDAPRGSTITHQEHAPVVLPAEVYERTIVLEYDHLAEEARQVVD